MNRSKWQRQPHRAYLGVLILLSALAVQCQGANMPAVAPDFVLPHGNGGTYRLSDHLGDAPVVVTFVPASGG
jgi:hypothetical protein